MPCASSPASLTTTLGATADPFSESSSIIFSFVSDIISYDERESVVVYQKPRYTLELGLHRRSAPDEN